MKSKKTYHILTVNPGSTSTKVGLFKNDELLKEFNINHSPRQIEKYDTVWDQYTFRKKEIIRILQKHNFDIGKLNAVVGRGGLIKAIPSGTYFVDQDMIEDARNGVQGHHASNLGCVIAYSIGWEYSIPALIVDPPAVDDFEPLARISGNKNYSRSSLLHALNIFATSRDYASSMKSKMEDLNLITAHMGGGISVAALRKGKAINSNNGLYEGPFTPERSGQLPIFKVLQDIDDGKYTTNQIRKMVVGKGGLVSYFDTNDAREIEHMAAAGSEEYRLTFEAMAYQVAEEIGKRATNLEGQVDAILLTGGLAYSDMLTEWITERVKFIAPVKRYPGEKELEALAQGAVRMLNGTEKAKNYTPQVHKIGVLYWDNIDVYVKSINRIEDKFRQAGYIFRKQENNLEFVYANCKRKESHVKNAVEDFIYKKVDLIFAIGSPASFRIGQYLKDNNVPVICTGIYNTNIISNISGKKKQKYSATCYSVPIKEQVEQTIIKFTGNKPKKVGALYKRGEYQSEIQFDDIKEYGRKENVEIIGYEIQSEDDFAKAKTHFTKKGVEWIFLCTSTDIAASKPEEMKKITHNFFTIGMHEDIISLGGYAGWVIPGKELCDNAVEVGFDILGNTSKEARHIIPKVKQLTVNKRLAEKLGTFKDLKKADGDISFI